MFLHGTLNMLRKWLCLLAIVFSILAIAFVGVASFEPIAFVGVSSFEPTIFLDVVGLAAIVAEHLGLQGVEVPA